MSWIKLWKGTFASMLPFLLVEPGRLGGGEWVSLPSFLTVPQDKTMSSDK